MNQQKAPKRQSERIGNSNGKGSIGRNLDSNYNIREQLSGQKREHRQIGSNQGSGKQSTRRIEEKRQRLESGQNSARKSPSKKRQESPSKYDQSTLSQTQPHIEQVKPKSTAKKGNSLDFNYYLNQMIAEQENKEAKENDHHIFKKKPFLSIKDLQSITKHIQKNKISDKLSRRDIQYYDLYALQDPPEDYDTMRNEGYPHTKLDAKIKEFYGDLAFPNFNSIFKNHGEIVKKQYGQTIDVSLSIKRGPDGKMKVQRIVKEDMSLKNNNVEVGTTNKEKDCHADDIQLQNLDQGLKNMEKEFGKTSAEIADIFCLVSGRLGKVREYLQYEKQQKEGGSQISIRSNQLKLGSLGGSGIVTWSYLEDLALKKPEDSPEFQVLIATKGLDEIQCRRDFLGATPYFQQQNS